MRIDVRLNGKQLTPCKHEGTELFPPPVPVNRRNPAAYPTRDALKFYAVPLDILVPGSNKVEIKNLDKQETTCKLISIELAMYKGGVPFVTNEASGQTD